MKTPIATIDYITVDLNDEDPMQDKLYTEQELQEKIAIIKEELQEPHPYQYIILTTNTGLLKVIFDAFDR